MVADDERALARHLHWWASQKPEDVQGLCFMAALELQEKFGARRIEGIGAAGPWGSPEFWATLTEHHWAELGGMVLDPTAHQYGARPHRWPLAEGLCWRAGALLCGFCGLPSPAGLRVRECCSFAGSSLQWLHRITGDGEFSREISLHHGGESSTILG